MVCASEELFGLQETWERALAECTRPDLFLTHEWFCSWWENLGEGHKLCCMVLEDEDRGGVGIAPLMEKQGTLVFLASHEVTDYCDFLFPQGREAEFHAAWMRYVGRNLPDIGYIELINMRGSSLTLELLPKAAEESGFSWRREVGEEVPILKLPTSYAEYLAGLRRKDRHELRRKLRRTEALGGVRQEVVSDPERIPTLLEEFIILHRAVHPDKDRFWRKPGMSGFFQAVLTRLAGRGMAALSVLYAGETQIASLIEAYYGRTVYFYNVAYSPDHAAASPGYALFDQAIRRAIRTGRQTADFLRGRERYKSEFGAEPQPIFSLTLTRH